MSSRSLEKAEAVTSMLKSEYPRMSSTIDPISIYVEVDARFPVLLKLSSTSSGFYARSFEFGVLDIPGMT
jgi:hypothetical protein